MNKAAHQDFNAQTPVEMRFSAAHVLNLYKWMEREGISIWIDGGWCVDALIGRETRSHQDLDIAVSRADNRRLRQLLKHEGYTEVECADSSEWMYVMKDPAGMRIDIHVFEYDEDGNISYGVEYPYGSLNGTGVIDGQSVRCIAPEWMFRFKTAYPPKEKDRADVRALSAKFGFSIPDGYEA